ncbi:MAG: cytochrome c biogenesis protein CcsA [Gammaproteobacteria bacterium]|nr:cytochrome c biogenesis protein CcsA [Gammaproteobacteria bacterium]
MVQLRAHRGADSESVSLRLAYLPAVVGCAIHVYFYSVAYRALGGIDFSLSGMMVLVSAILSALFLLGCAFMPIRRLGLLVFPLAAFSLVFAYLWNSEVIVLEVAGKSMTVHILLSIAAFALLTIAAVQALLYLYQDRQFKRRTNPAMLMALPPLQTMESLLVKLVTSGFVLLTIALISGAAFSREIFGQAFEFKHHTVLALAGWVVFGVLLWQRFKGGLSGHSAAIWVVAGAILLQLGYFGTKFISESLNIQ